MGQMMIATVLVTWSAVLTAAPAWFSDNVEFLKELLQNPTRVIRTAIVSFVAGGLLYLAETIVGGVVAALEPFTELPGVMADAYIYAGKPVGDLATNGVAAMWNGAEAFAANNGVLGYLVVVFIASISVVIVARLARWLVNIIGGYIGVRI